DLHQQVGQHRQGLATVDHVDDLRQRLEKHFALQAETHSVLPLCPVLREGIKQKLGGGGAAKTAGKPLTPGVIQEGFAPLNPGRTGGVALVQAVDNFSLPVPVQSCPQVVSKPRATYSLSLRI